MLEPGFTVTSPRGTVVEILENTPERFVLKRILPPDTGKTPSHRHDNGIERFRLIEGEAMGSVGGTARRLREGDVMEVPVGTAHVHPHTDGATIAAVEHIIEPRPRFVPVFFASWLTWLGDRRDEPMLAVHPVAAQAVAHGAFELRERELNACAPDSVRQVVRERDLLRRPARRAVPVAPRLAVAADVLVRAAKREQHEALGPAVDELATDRRPDPHELAALEHVLLALDQQRQRAVEDQVDLLLLAVAMDAPALQWLEHDLVHPEARHAELAPQRHEALAGVGLKARTGDAFLHASRSYVEHGSARRRARYLTIDAWTQSPWVCRRRDGTRSR
jgi:anti-sigma factor ChrR (cupin superfamily)